jgi:NAD(P)-dependent dehydrogenase (short-subunit alcohol dehydrogenase family)
MGLLDGRTCVVTGVGPGMGQATAKALAREGGRVFLAARSKDFLDQVAAEIGDPERAVVFPTDITDRAQCEALVEAAGTIDVLVNSAFKPDVFQPFVRVDLQEYRSIFEVNVFGTLQMTQAAIPAMKERGGSIVFVNSMVVRKGGNLQTGYSASKGALLGAAKSLALELGRYKIRVNSVVPGWMLGPSVEMYLEFQSQKRGVSREDILGELGALNPLGAIPTQEACAEAVVFLASDLSAAMTGQSVDVNGGEHFH